MNLNLLNNTSKEEVYCCRKDNNKGWKNSINTLILFFVMVLGHAATAAPPTVVSFAPSTCASGQAVLITGTNFTAVTGVYFGNTPATTFTVLNTTTISAVVGTGSSGSVKVTAVGGNAQKAGFTFVPAPSCNLSGILKQCLADGNIEIETTIQFSTATPTLTYSFPAGPQNTAGSSLVFQGPITYDAINDVATQTVTITPGVSGGQINFQLLVNTTGGVCECSKSITIVDLGLELSYNPIECFGRTTSLFADATSSGSSNYTFTLNPGNITVGPQSDPSVEFLNVPAGSYTITVTDNNGCSKQEQVTVTQPPLNPVVLNCPENKIETSCKSQAEINASFTAWLQSFNYSGGTNPTLQVTPSSPSAPLICNLTPTVVTVTWTVSDDCGQPQSCTRTFTLTPPPAVITGAPVSVSHSSCDYANQAAVNAAFATWLAGFTVSGGCDPHGNYGEVAPPALCQGGTTTVTYNITDRCYTNAITRTFSIVPAPHVDVTGPANVNLTSCAYPNQTALNAAFALWVAQFQTANAGCGAQAHFNITEFAPPSLCQGGSVTLLYSIADNCSSDSVVSTFSITPAAHVDVTGPANVNLTSCAYPNQAALNLAFAAWVAQFQTLNAGCGAEAHFNISEFQAPSLCAGGTVVLTYSITDNCSTDSVTASFTITPAAHVDVTGPANVNLTSCAYPNQAALNLAFAAWVAQFQTVNPGCGAQANFTTQFQAPSLCAGGTVTLTYRIADNCSEDSATATFTITPAAHVDVTGPANVNLTSCAYPNQAALNVAFAAWVAQFQTVNAGCGAQANFTTQFQAPSLCAGGTVTLTYRIADNCSEDSATATFTITPAAHVDVTGPANVNLTSCAYPNQAALNAAFTAWLAQFQTVNAGCGAEAHFNITEFAPPSLCQGGTVTLVYSIADNCSQDSVTSTFTITHGASVDVTGPANVNLTSCAYPNQAALDLAFAAWVAQFQTVNAGCDAQAHFNITEFQAPRLCAGGTVALTYSIADNCSEDSVSASFIITPAAHVDVTGPANVNLTSCAYANQAELNAAFALWVAQFQTVNAGCGAQGHFNSEFSAPSLCQGGTVTLTYSIADNCSEDSATATFTITPAAHVDVTGPANVNLTSCAYPNQTALNAAFALWVAQFQTVNAGCGAQGHFNSEFSAPSLCAGGTVTLVYSIADNCTSDSVTATFTITPAAHVDVTGPANVNLTSCAYPNQTALNAAFALWVAQFQTVNAGCDAQAHFNITEFQAPSLCAGGTVTLVYSIADNCSDDSVTATFTITPAAHVDVTGPANVNLTSCAYPNQAALNAAFALWVAQFQTVNAGCGAQAHFNITEFQAPSLCAGGTVTLTYSIADNCSEDSVSASFSITHGASVDVTGPANATHTSCEYTSQAAVDAAFALWLAQFQTVNAGCDAQAHFNISEYQIPRMCGGTITLTYSIADNCSSDSVTASFTITPSAPVDVTGPANATHTSCEYADQAAVDAAFALWLAQFQTVNAGCLTNQAGGPGQGHFNITEFQAPRLCAGGTLELTYSIADNCSTDSVTASFTITPSAPVDVTGPANATHTSCDYADQAAVDAAFALWLAQFQTVNAGCLTNGNGGPGQGHFNISEFQAPRICVGGTLELTYSIADNCSQDSVTASFTITPAAPVVITSADNATHTSCEYADQAALDAAFAAWLNGFGVSGGCDPSGTFQGTPTAPSLCEGGNVCVVYNVIDKCYTGSVVKHFIITPSAHVDVTGPANATHTSCEYTSQTEVDAAFALWLAQFQTVNSGCDALAHFNISEYQIPRMCGGTITLTYSIADNCSQDSVTASFTITPSAPVDVTGPANATHTSCDYADQAAVDAAFALWLAQFQTVNAGCLTNGNGGPGQGHFNITEFQSPRLCGGTIELTYSIADNCTSDSVTASFTITPSTPVDVTGPANATHTSCDYADQAAVDAAFALWLAQFQTVNAGCLTNGNGGPGQGHFNISEFQAPRLCNGGTLELTYSIADNCTSDSVTASFTITHGASVDVTGPANATHTSCDYADQAAVDAAFALWLAQFQTVNAGCGAQAHFNITEYQAPRLCNGGTIELTYSIADNCSSDSVTASFTITHGASVDVSGPANATHTSCEYADQAAVDAAFAAWVAQFQTVNVGCGAQGHFTNTEFQAPRLCNGGTVELTYSIADNCSTDSVTASFTLTHGASVDVTGPSSVTNYACDYASQSAVNAAFAAWLAQFQTVNAGCGAQAHFNTSEFQAPNLCAGGTVQLTYSIADNCSSDSVSASFTLTPPSQVHFNCGSSVTIPACTSQADVNAAFATFLASTTASGGCNGVLTHTQASAPSACGGYVDVTWTYSVSICGQQSGCGPNNSMSCTKRFTVQAPPQVQFNCGNSVTLSSCKTQAEVNTAFATFLASTTASGGCNGVLTHTQASAPSACGGYVDVTWTYTVGSCGQQTGCGNGNSLTCTKRFTVQAPPQVVFNCGNNVTLSSCKSQAEVNAAFATFLASTTASGGCNGVLTRTQASAPSSCGGYVDVTWTYTVGSCGQQTGCGNGNSLTCTKRFTVQAPPQVIFNCASSVTVAACSTQTQVNAAFATWLASTTVSGGCNGVLTRTSCTAPPACGGYVDVTWTYTVGSCGQQSGCGNTNSQSCTKRFTVAAPPAVVFNCASNVTLGSCKTQAEVNAAFATFLSSTTASGGCNGVLTRTSCSAPSACGGYVDVTWTYTVGTCGQQSGCGNTNSQSCTKRFTVQAPPAVVFNCASSVTVPSCSTQAQINTAWAAFKASTNVIGGCNGVLTNNAPANPPSTCGGYVDVTWTYTVGSCGQQTGCGSNTTMTCTKRFTVAAAPAVTFNAGSNRTVASCSTQAQINSAWATFLASTTVSGGCNNGTLTNNAPANPPSACGGYVDVTWTYTSPNNCGQIVCGSYTTSGTYSTTKRFTVNAAAPVVFNCGSNRTVASCSTQAQVNSAWAAFLASTTVETNGCSTGTLTNNAPANPPSSCGGYVDVTWTYTAAGGCGSQVITCGSYNTTGTYSCTKRFTVTGGGTVDVTGPSNANYNSCSFSSQSALNYAFSCWLAQFRTLASGCDVTPGCGYGGAVAVFSGDARTAPSLVNGGTVRVTYSIAGSCNQDSVCATFVVTRNTNCGGGCKVAPPVDNAVTTKEFSLKAYPNPFTETFNLSLTTSSEEKVSMVVYDMAGRLLEQREVNAAEVSELQVGDRYPSGVYNLIITQGADVKTLRVIKR